MAYSSKSIPNARDKALSVGCVEYIENPSEGNRILTIISDILTSSHQPEGEFVNNDENYNFQNGVSGFQEKTLEGRKIMLVDDDARNLYATTSFLENQGATIVAVNNAPEAVEKLKEDPSFELVLMDIMMPEMDGYEATRQIREFEILKDIPIIAVTAKAMPEDREKAMTSGFDDFVAKPIVNEELLMIIEKHLPQKNLQ